MFRRALHVATGRRGCHDITGRLEAMVAESGVQTGLCHVFLAHTSASLILCENADPTVRADLEDFLARLAPDGDPRYRHRIEGPDDMAAHLRSVLTGCSLTLPVHQGRLALGTWQGVFVYEHRHRAGERLLWVTVYD
ncbi:MAG: hypothetical protein KatS3mg121_0508 [Gammaproteobacteria bacterium]|nr:MAG: hypothetical protein KatS3mg121_0508 [Gammaproteobacteria bacterium]